MHPSGYFLSLCLLRGALSTAATAATVHHHLQTPLSLDALHQRGDGQIRVHLSASESLWHMLRTGCQQRF